MQTNADHMDHRNINLRDGPAKMRMFSIKNNAFPLFPLFTSFYEYHSLIPIFTIVTSFVKYYPICNNIFMRIIS